MTLSALSAQIARYRQAADRQTYDAVVRQLAVLAASGETLAEGDRLLARQLAVECAHLECAWSLLLAQALWGGGARAPGDFLNHWNFARFSGFASKFSRLTTAEHLELARGLKAECPSPAVFVLLGNALRDQHQYAAAEDIYLEAIHRFPACPFIRFRLADLWLATYRLDPARQLLATLHADYPYARELMFIVPADGLSDLPANLFPALECERPLVWFVAADPVYVERYAARLLDSIRKASGNDFHVHLHVIRDPDTPMPGESIAALQREGLNITERTLSLSRYSEDQRKTVFACERFLFLAELLTKYQRPLLLTDIDIECMKHPGALFERMTESDIGFTSFRDTNEAWERYAATALLVKPGAAAIEFFGRMAALLVRTLASHPQPWFADQIALYRCIEELPHRVRLRFLENILTDADPPSPSGYFRILHGSWK